MTLDHRQHHLQTLRSALAVVLYPLQHLANLPQSGGQWFAEGLATRQELQEENASLRTQLLLQQAQLQRFEGLLSENIRLRELLDSSRRVSERLLIAEIMSADLKPFSHQIMLNKGTRKGVYVGQPILDADGVMGQIVSVTLFTSNAMLISDPSHAIPITVNRNGLRGIAIGEGASTRLDIPNLPNNVDIEVGDLLVTSGLDGRFPTGYPVATVTEVKKDPAHPFATVTAHPTAKLDRSREALLVWPNKNRDDTNTPSPCPDETASCAPAATVDVQTPP